MPTIRYDLQRRFPVLGQFDWAPKHLVTWGSKTEVVYNYPCDGMVWLVTSVNTNKENINRFTPAEFREFVKQLQAYVDSPEFEALEVREAVKTEVLHE